MIDKAPQNRRNTTQLAVAVTGYALIHKLLTLKLGGGVAAARDLSAILQGISPNGSNHAWDETQELLASYFVKYPALALYFEGHDSGELGQLFIKRNAKTSDTDN